MTKRKSPPPLKCPLLLLLRQTPSQQERDDKFPKERLRTSSPPPPPASSSYPSPKIPPSPSSLIAIERRSLFMSEFGRKAVRFSSTSCASFRLLFLSTALPLLFLMIRLFSSRTLGNPFFFLMFAPILPPGSPAESLLLSSPRRRNRQTLENGEVEFISSPLSSVFFYSFSRSPRLDFSPCSGFWQVRIHLLPFELLFFLFFPTPLSLRLLAIPLSGQHRVRPEGDQEGLFCFSWIPSLVSKTRPLCSTRRSPLMKKRHLFPSFSFSAVR